MVEIANGFNQAALAEMIEKGFRSRGSYGPNPIKDLAEHAAQIVFSRISVNATLSGASAPEPAAGTVRVRIPVTIDQQGKWSASGWHRGDDESMLDATVSMEIADCNSINHWVTADIPLPQPTEIPGTVESDK